MPVANEIEQKIINLIGGKVVATACKNGAVDNPVAAVVVEGEPFPAFADPQIEAIGQSPGLAAYIALVVNIEFNFRLC